MFDPSTLQTDIDHLLEPIQEQMNSLMMTEKDHITLQALKREALVKAANIKTIIQRIDAIFEKNK